MMWTLVQPQTAATGCSGNMVLKCGDGQSSQDTQRRNTLLCHLFIFIFQTDNGQEEVHHSVVAVSAVVKG